MTTTALKRKKQPEVIRQQLLECAGILAAERGPAALTLDSVAQHAGVSKGGLLHHFPNKQALITALLEDCFGKIDLQIQQFIATDPAPIGRHTRAYLHVIARHQNDPESRTWGVLCAVMLFEPALRERYRDWFKAHMDYDVKCGADVTALSIVRLAADGLWIADLLGNQKIAPLERSELIAALSDMTAKKQKSGPPHKTR